MNIGELKEAIKGLPNDMNIILQKDGEGNGYSPLYGVDPNFIYIADNEYSGEVYSLGFSADDAGFEENEWKYLKLEHSPSLILVPTN